MSPIPEKKGGGGEKGPVPHLHDEIGTKGSHAGDANARFCGAVRSSDGCGEKNQLEQVLLCCCCCCFVVFIVSRDKLEIFWLSLLFFSYIRKSWRLRCRPKHKIRQLARLTLFKLLLDSSWRAGTTKPRRRVPYHAEEGGELGSIV